MPEKCFCHLNGLAVKDAAARKKIDGAWVTPQMFGAKGNGVTDDTAAIQACFDSGANTVLFPEGVYAISETLYINFNMLKHDSYQKIIGSGAKITARDNFTGSELIRCGDNVNGNGTQKIVFDGLTIDGKHVADGIRFDQCHEFSVANTNIVNCNTGITVQDVYYGNIGNRVSFGGNITAMRFVPNDTSENNTIRVENVRIDGTYNDYSGDTIGIKIDSGMLGVTFSSVVIENCDYAILGKSNTDAYFESFFNIENCYFEKIHKCTICLFAHTITDGIVELVEGAVANHHTYIVKIANNHFNAGSCKMALSDGTWYLESNHYPYGVVCKIDAYNGISGFNLYSNQYVDVGIKHPTQNKVFISLDNEAITTPKLRESKNYGLMKTKKLELVTDEDVVMRSNNGMIIKDIVTGAYKKLVMVNDQLRTMPVTNQFVIEPSFTVLTPEEAWKLKDTLADGDTVKVMFAPAHPVVDVTYKNGKFVSSSFTGATTEHILIGTIEDYIQQVTASGYTAPGNYTLSFYDVNVKRHLLVANAGYCGTLYDHMGSAQSTGKYYGTLAKRPTSGMVEYQTYYATDESKYYMVLDGAWGEVLI